MINKKKNVIKSKTVYSVLTNFSTSRYEIENVETNNNKKKCDINLVLSLFHSWIKMDSFGVVVFF